tara:strand:- start:195 stop:392 length:198 start_codon:yes stop_codon:yes gene_type:complete
MTVRELRRALNNFPDNMQVRFYIDEPSVYKIMSITKGEIDSDLWVDTKCDGPMGGEIEVVQIQIG